MIKPVGRALVAYNRGYDDAKNGLKDSDNPYRNQRISNGAEMLASWWSTGFVHATNGKRRQHPKQESSNGRPNKKP